MRIFRKPGCAAVALRNRTLEDYRDNATRIKVILISMSISFSVVSTEGDTVMMCEGDTIRLIGGPGDAIKWLSMAGFEEAE